MTRHALTWNLVVITSHSLRHNYISLEPRHSNEQMHVLKCSTSTEAAEYFDNVSLDRPCVTIGIHIH